MKRISTIGLLLLSTMLIWAEEVSFRAQAPAQVIVGKPFQLTYTVNQRARDLKVAELTDFEHLAGPFTSQSSSTSFVNGKRTSTFTQTFTYTLMATHEGTFTIQPASIRVDGDTYTSNGVKITVLPPDEAVQQQSQAGNSRSNQTTSSSQSGENISSENIFMRTIVSKIKVQEQEALLLSYKLYFAGVDVAQFTNNTKIPEFTGFLKQELEQGEIQTELEHYNGRNYQTATIYRTLLYPQHSGDIKIDPASFEAVLRVQVRQQVRSIFDDFFGSYTNVTKALTAPGVTIHVDGLPGGKPAGFSGGVGQFSMTGEISQTQLTTNDPVTIRLTIKGSGNMKLLKTPAIDWPEGFEAYDPKVTNQFKTTTAGVSGSKEVEYLAIARAAGEYTIPAIRFSYFDTQERAYKTETLGPWTLQVKRGANEQDATVQQFNNGAATQKENIKQLGQDIRYIRTEPLRYSSPKGEWIKADSIVACLYLLPMLVAMVLFIIFRRRIRENADSNRVRYKKANKVAQKRLKEAKMHMDANETGAFYEAIERAAWTYLSDRLSIPTANLNKENIASLLSEKQVSEALVKEVINVLSTAEFARYAPASDHAMQDLYEQTTQLINNLENQRI